MAYLQKLSSIISINCSSKFLRYAGYCTVKDAEGKTHMPSVSDINKYSKSMRLHLERAQEQENYLKEQAVEFEIGRRHLANIMGQDPATFTQKDIDNAIEYLFPSGLFEKRARPHMKPPDEVFSKAKEAQFDETGRPFHFLFYTGLSSYYNILHDLTTKYKELEEQEFKFAKLRIKPDLENKLDVGASEWINKEELEGRILARLKDDHYEYLITCLTRLLDHPYSAHAAEFIMSYRKSTAHQQIIDDIPELMMTDSGVPYMTAAGRRKRANATVTVFGNGSGKITINDSDILYFPFVQDREQIVFPLQFTGLMDKVDIEARVEGGGPTGQSGAIRYALSVCLRCFVGEDMREKMRLIGLLSYDRRTRERKKPGQEGARRKFTWKKR